MTDEENIPETSQRNMPYDLEEYASQDPYVARKYADAISNEAKYAMGKFLLETHPEYSKDTLLELVFNESTGTIGLKPELQKTKYKELFTVDYTSSQLDPDEKTCCRSLDHAYLSIRTLEKRHNERLAKKYYYKLAAIASSNTENKMDLIRKTHEKYLKQKWDLSISGNFAANMHNSIAVSAKATKGSNYAVLAKSEHYIQSSISSSENKFMEQYGQPEQKKGFLSFFQVKK